jgi:hypothetical protein
MCDCLYGVCLIHRVRMPVMFYKNLGAKRLGVQSGHVGALVSKELLLCVNASSVVLRSHLRQWFEAGPTQHLALTMPARLSPCPSLRAPSLPPRPPLMR